MKDDFYNSFVQEHNTVHARSLHMNADPGVASLLRKLQSVHTKSKSILCPHIGAK